MSPFKIIQKRPVKITAHVNAFLNCLMNPPQVIYNESRAPFIFGVSYAVFGNIDCLAIMLQFLERVINTFGINLPSQIILRTVGWRIHIKTLNQTMKIIIKADKILIILYPIKESLIPKPTDNRRQPTFKICIIFRNADF